MNGFNVSASLIDAIDRCATGDNQSDSCKRVDEGKVGLGGTQLEKSLNRVIGKSNIKKVSLHGSDGFSVELKGILKMDMLDKMRKEFPDFGINILADKNTVVIRGIS